MVEFYAVCHAKMDSINRGIERLQYYEGSKELKKNVNVLLSFSQVYSPNKAASIELPSNVNKVMIDSGAYDFQVKKKGEFPYTPKEYFDQIKKISLEKKNFKINYLVSMDYICMKNDSPEIIKNKIKKTVNNAKILNDLIKNDKNIHFKLIPVLQGYKSDDYIYCAKELIDNGIINSTSYIGIGSLANRKKISEIKEIVVNVDNYFKKRFNSHNIKIHLFGINLNAIKNKEIFSRIYSFDSFSWTFPYRFGRVKIFTGVRMIEANTRKKLKEPEFYEISLRTTIDYVNFLNDKISNEKKPTIQENRNEKNNYLAILKDKQESEFSKIKEISKRFQKTNKVFVFTGEKSVILEPKNVVLSPEEQYFVLRYYTYLFMAKLLYLFNNNSKRMESLE